MHKKSLTLPVMRLSFCSFHLFSEKEATIGSADSCRLPGGNGRIFAHGGGLFVVNVCNVIEFL